MMTRIGAALSHLQSPKRNSDHHQHHDSIQEADKPRFGERRMLVDTDGDEVAPGAFEHVWRRWGFGLR